MKSSQICNTAQMLSVAGTGIDFVYNIFTLFLTSFSHKNSNACSDTGRALKAPIKGIVSRDLVPLDRSDIATP
jgi:hypothetical protein